LAIAARVINIIVLVVVAIILFGIVLYLLGANETNAVVGFFLPAARFLVGPFNSLFEIGDNRVQVALNWGDRDARLPGDRDLPHPSARAGRRPACGRRRLSR
jgi:hypothetical protein